MCIILRNLFSEDKIFLVFENIYRVVYLLVLPISRIFAPCEAKCLNIVESL